MPNNDLASAPSRDDENWLRKQVRAIHGQSFVILLVGIAGLVGAGSTIVVQPLLPGSRADELSLKAEIERQQSQIRQLTAQELAEKDLLASEQRKFQEREKQLQNQVQELEAKIADAPDNLPSTENQTGVGNRLRHSEPSETPGVSGEARRHEGNSPPQQAVDAGVFRFQPQNCTRTGTRSHCSGTVTNLGDQQENLNLRWDESYVVDDSNNQIPLSNQIFKLGDGTRKPLQPKLPIAFYISLEDDQKDTTRITLILSMAASMFPLPLEHNARVRLEFSVVGR